ncbi:hypothetical protein EMIT0P228_60022 [Pseudomonas brassicacearum]
MAFVGKRRCENGVPCLNDRAANLLAYPDTLGFAVVNLFDPPVTSWIVIGCIDDDDFLGSITQRLLEIRVFSEGDREDNNVNLGHSLFLGHRLYTDFVGEVLNALGALRVCQFNFMAAGSELTGKGSPNVACADNSDFHFNKLLTYQQLFSYRLAGCANELSVSRSASNSSGVS